MSASGIIENLILGIVGVAITALLVRIYAQVRILARRLPLSRTHFRFYRGRMKFNELGIEILNGAVSGDTVYLVLRSGTFIGDFAKALASFRSHADTKCVVITPSVQVFLSNYGPALQAWVTDIYENANCGGIRAMLLEPGMRTTPSPREAGYLFVSDGHNHDDDEGFYAASPQAIEFIRGYILDAVKAATPASFT